MTAVVAEILTDSTSRIRCEELHRRGIRSGRRNHDRVIHCAENFQLLHDLRNCRCLLPDRDVNTDNVFALLVDDRVDRDGGLAGLAVADYKLTLATADRDHGVDRLETGLKRLFHRLAIDDTGSNSFDRIIDVGDDLTLAIDRITESVDHTADHRIAHGDAHDPLRAFHFVAFFDLLKVAEQYSTDLVFFEVQRKTSNAVRKLEQLARHHLFQTVDLGNSVADLYNRPDLIDRHTRIEVLDLGTDNFINFVRFKCFHMICSLIVDGCSLLIHRQSQQRTTIHELRSNKL